MTSFLFGQAPGDYVVDDNGSGGVAFAPGATLVGWNMKDGGTAYGMASDAAYSIPLAAWKAGDSGLPNPAYGPDEVKQMWVSADGGPRVLMTGSDVAATLGDRIAAITNGMGQPNGSATLDGSGRVPVSQLPGSAGGALALNDLSDVDAPDAAEGEILVHVGGVWVSMEGLAAILGGEVDLGVRTTPLAKFVDDHVPDASEPNKIEFWSTYSGVPKLVAWQNERGMYRAEQIPGGTGWESPFKAIVNAVGTGAAYGIERRNADNSRTTIGGFDVNARTITSLQEWTAVTAYDPGATGWYSAGMADTAGGGGPYTYDPLGCRMDTDDIVRMRGLVAVADPGGGTNLSSGDVLFTVPAGFAPSVARAIVVGFRGGKAFPCVVTPAGSVVVRQGQSNGGASDVYFDGVTYLL